MAIDAEALKARSDIVAVVGAYVQLKKRGAEYLSLCPFHDDHTPSFHVIPSKQFCHCFSCGASHDVISFVQAIEGVDFVTACEKLGATNDWKPRKGIRQEAKRPERVTSKPPPDAPPPDFTKTRLGAPERVFPILDLDGATLGFEVRYKDGEGKKVPIIWSWGKRGEEPAAWGMGAFNAPRPLYGLQRLALRPEAPVSVFEGPKKADAGNELLPQYVCISWTGGAQAWHKHSLEPLRGRQVLLWPDADAAGWTACDKLAAVLADPAGLACRVRIVDTHGQPEAWDIANALEDGWDTAQLVAWAKPRAKDYAPPNPAPDAEAPAEVAPVDAAPVAGVSADEPIPLEAYKEETRKPKRGTTPPPDDDDEALPATMSEDMLADRMMRLHGSRWRYVKVWNSWFHWDGGGWREDKTALMDRLAVEITRQALNWPEAKDLKDEARRRINSRRTAGAVRDIAMSDRRIAATADQWDTDSWLLGVPGGVVDLKAGKLIEARPEDYITKRCAVAPEKGKPELWLEFLRRITDGDEDLISYLQRFAGYSMTGETAEHALCFLYGTGANGKTTFLQTLSGVLGDYAMSAGFEVFAETRNERHPTEIARLRGARLVVTEETDAGGRWNESRIKRLTGGGKISAHFMRQDDFEFEPQFKLLIAGNHKPMIKAVDEAIKRRIHLIPFTVTIPPEDRDKALFEKLRAEWPRILQWCIDGCMAWQDYSLSPTERIVTATEQYVESEDVLGSWINDSCDISTPAMSEGRALFENYRKWCEEQGEHAWGRRSWSNAMLDRGFSQKRSATARMFQGITLKPGAGLPASRY